LHNRGASSDSDDASYDASASDDASSDDDAFF